MREIKFRAWDKGSNEMVKREISGFWLDEFNQSENLADVEEKGFILMQYTGLKDKNGKEIYEGDVVKDKNGIKSVIEFDSACFVARIIKGDGFCSYAWRDCEIIGNIHQNPELIKQGTCDKCGEQVLEDGNRCQNCV